MAAVLHWQMLQTQACRCSNLEGKWVWLTTGRFVKILVIEIFSSVLGLFGLIIGLLVSGKAPDFK
jgi:hypothetical protein